MASEENSVGVSEERVRRLEAKFDELTAASDSLKMTGRIMSLALVLVSVTLVIRMLYPFYTLYQNKGVLAQYLMKDMEQRIAPLAKEEAHKLYNEDLKGWLAKELEVRKQKTFPKLVAALEREGQFLLDDLSEKLRLRFATEAHSFNARYAERFRKEFPELADDAQAEKIIGNLQSSLEHAADRILDDYFKMHRDALIQMGLTYDKVEVPPHIRTMSNDQLVTHALGLLSEIAAVRFDLEGEFTLNVDPGARAGAPASSN